LTRYATIRGSQEVDVTAATAASGSHTVLLQHTGEAGRGISSVRWELRPESATGDRLGPGYLLEPGDGPVSVPVASDRHLVAWRSSGGDGPAAILAVTVTNS